MDAVQVSASRAPDRVFEGMAFIRPWGVDGFVLVHAVQAGCTVGVGHSIAPLRPGLQCLAHIADVVVQLVGEHLPLLAKLAAELHQLLQLLLRLRPCLRSNRPCTMPSPPPWTHRCPRRTLATEGIEGFKGRRRASVLQRASTRCRNGFGLLFAGSGSGERAFGDREHL